MRKFLLAVGILAIGLLYANACFAINPIPAGVGVNFHFTGAPAKDLDMIKAAGFNMARTDLKWDRVEKTKGQYIWTEYDQLIDGLIARGITPYMILDYNNSLYGAPVMNGISSDAQRQGYTNFAKAAAARYKGKSIIWEIWNEPNMGMFWGPVDNAADYVKLVKSAVPAMKAADPNCIVVGPAVAFIANTFDYIKACAAQGLFNYIDGLSLHPYKNAAPESGDIQYLYSAVRDILNQYGKSNLPILGGEFGFSTAWSNIGSEQTQAEYLVRQLVLHDQLNIPVSIVYDFRNDGTDPNNVEHNFGTIRNDYSIKPAYTAIQKLRSELAGYNYSSKLSSNSGDYIFEYTSDAEKKVAAWTTGSNHNATIYGNSVELTRMPVYVSNGATPPVDPPTPPPSSDPATPVINKINMDVSQLTGDYYAVINFADNSNTETGFDLYQSVNNANSFQFKETAQGVDGKGIATVKYKIGQSPTSGTYYYKLVAKFSDGYKLTSNTMSAEVNVTPPVEPPTPPPSSDPATPVINKINMAVRASNDVYYAVINFTDKSNTETGFDLYQSIGNTNSFRFKKTAQGVDGKGIATVKYKIGQSPTSGTYYYKLVAKFSDGYKLTSNTMSAEIQNSTPPTPVAPATPTNLSIFSSKDTAKSPVTVLNWNDASTDEDGFNIYCSASQTGPFNKVGEVNKDASNVVHTIGQRGSFFYQIKSFNSAGESASSTTVPVTVN